jgi:hypothetical protein
MLPRHVICRISRAKLLMWYDPARSYDAIIVLWCGGLSLGWEWDGCVCFAVAEFGGFASDL